MIAVLRLFAVSSALCLAACGAAPVPAWSPDPAPGIAEPVDVAELAAELQKDPELKVEPVSADAEAPPEDAWLVRLPAAGASADGARAAEGVLYQALIDLGITTVQLELLQAAADTERPALNATGDPGLIVVRLRRAPAGR